MRAYLLVLAVLLPVLLSCDRSVESGAAATGPSEVILVPRLILAPGIDSATYLMTDSVYVELEIGQAGQTKSRFDRIGARFADRRVVFRSVPAGVDFTLGFQGVKAGATIWRGTASGNSGTQGATVSSGVDNRTVAIEIQPVDLTLQSLSIDGTPLAGFIPATRSYVVGPFASTKTSVSVDAIAGDAQGTVVSCFPGSCASVPLSGTSTRVRIVVRSRSESSDSLEYVLDIGRNSNPPIDASLSSLALLDSTGAAGIALAPGFDPSHLIYANRDTLPAATSALRIAAVASDGDATVRCNGQACGLVSLAAPLTTVDVVVENRGAKRVYALSLVRHRAADDPISRTPELTSLQLLDSTAGVPYLLTPAFHADTKAYATEDSLPASTAWVRIEAGMSDPLAVLTCDGGSCGEIPLTGPEKVVAIEVAKGASSSSYTLTIRRRQPPVAPPPRDTTLTSLVLRDATGSDTIALDPVFRPDGLSYATADSLLLEAATVQILATPKDRDARVTCNGGACLSIPLSGPRTVVHLVVENGGDSLAYRVVVLRKTAWSSYSWDFETYPGGRSDSIEGGGTIVSENGTAELYRSSIATMNGSAGEAVMRWTLREAPGLGGYDEWAIARLPLIGGGIDPRTVRFLEFEARAGFPASAPGAVRVELSHPDPECNGTGGRLGQSLTFSSAGGSTFHSLNLLNLTYQPWASSTCQAYTLDQILRSLRTVDFLIVPRFETNGTLSPDPQSGELRIDNVRIR